MAGVTTNAGRRKRAERNTLLKLQVVIENTLKSAKSEDKISVAQLRAAIDEFNTLLAAFNTASLALIAARESDGQFEGKTEQEIEAIEAADMVDYDNLRLVYCRLKGEVEQLAGGATSAASRKSLLSSTLATEGLFNPSHIKVPEIAVPKFDGDLRKFKDWCSLFENMVHLNDQFDPLKKLYYLKAALQGDAAQLLSDTPLTEAAYFEAWTEVKHTYDNKRLIVASHFEDLLELKPIRNEGEIRDSLMKQKSIMRGLKICGLDPKENSFAAFACYLVTTKLEPSILREWEKSINDNTQYPSLTKMHEFLTTMQFVHDTSVKSSVRYVEPKDEKVKKSDETEKAFRKQGDKSNKKASFVSSAIQCSFCKCNHFTAFCEKFLAKSVVDRFTMAKEFKLCTNCLKPTHKTSECKAQHCKLCQKPHNTTLHRDDKNAESNPESNPTKEKTPESSTYKASLSATVGKPLVSLLPSAVVNVMVSARPVKSRLLLDNCSQGNLVTEKFVRRNRIATYKSQSAIAGITNDVVRSNFSCKLTIVSRVNNFRIVVDANVIPCIPYKVDRTALSSVSSKVQGLVFADSDLLSEEVDIVLGVEFVNICLLGNKTFVNQICFEESQFGWVASGAVNRPTSTKYCQLIREINFDLRAFWEVENVESSAVASSKLDSCVKYVENTLTCLRDGHFSVSLPFHTERSAVANTFRSAMAALKRSESLKDDVRNPYVEFMKEYLSLGHMELVPPNEVAASPQYYLPHHAVLRPSSSTTKLRVVFNASAKNSSGCSLNDILRIGPTIQPELFDQLVSVRMYPIAFTADIAKMYRCIYVNPEDRNMQRILWRFNKNDPVQHYRLKTVTYGTAPASFLATKCLAVVADTIESRDSAAARAIRSEFYMDDLLTGANGEEEAIEKRRIIHTSLAKAQFPLRKYASNSQAVLASIEPEMTESSKIVDFSSSEVVSMLGLQWEPRSDRFRVNVQLPSLDAEKLTKRVGLSLIAKVFDPLGILSPVTIVGKILIQDLWREELDWDELVPPRIKSSFVEYYSQLSELSEFAIPRPYSTIQNCDRCLIGFCDASPKAYCAVIYLKTVSNGNSSSIALVCAKTKVAPIKSLTIPRLELMAAVILTKLLIRVNHCFKVDVSKIFAYSDSTIVLSWLRNPKAKLEVFVRNRVNYILSELNASVWNFVSTQDNPADLGTRGVSAKSLLGDNYTKWVSGPNWLELPLESKKSSELSELVPNMSLLVKTSVINSEIAEEYFNRFSSYTKLLRVTAYVNSFVHNCRALKCNRQVGPLSAESLRIAHNKLIRLSQFVSFPDEVEALSQKHGISKSSKLLSLNPFVDDQGIIRAHGRLASSNFSNEVKFPVIISAKCRFLKLFVTHAHVNYFHAGKSFVINFVRSRFYVIGGLAQIVKGVIFQCIRCTRMKAATLKQLMGDLPIERTLATRPFLNVGVDLAGPFSVKCVNHRSTRYGKLYAAFFVCFAIKAVHIEIVPDLTTDSFMSALDRFCSRRGLPAKIFSDNGTNFVGTNNALVDKAAQRSIDWQFIPARSPHVGGLWEAAVKSGKKLLRNTIGVQALNYDEYVTVFAKIEAILNSRPLCRIKTGEDYEPLTPAHFLIGTTFHELALTDNVRLSLTRRYTQLQTIIRSFWRTWSQDYVNQLHARSKWKESQPNIEAGDLVLVRKSDTSSLEWPLGKVASVFPDSKGQVRIVEVQTASGLFRRAVTELVKLPTEEIVSSAGEHV